jgi:serine protease
MMVEANPKLNASQIIARLQAGARPFPVPATPPAGGVCHVATLSTDSAGNYTDIQENECQCTTSTCGAGMVNAPGALAQALAPQASIVATPGTAAVGQTVNLDGSGSSAAAGYSITAYQWSVDPSVSISNASSAVASLKFPAFRPINVTLTVTDSAGRQSVATQTVNSRAYSGSASGGGAIVPWELTLLAAGALLAFLRRRMPSAAMLRGRPGLGTPSRPRKTVHGELI